MILNQSEVNYQITQHPVLSIFVFLLESIIDRCNQNSTPLKY